MALQMKSVSKALPTSANAFRRISSARTPILRSEEPKKDFDNFLAQISENIQKLPQKPAETKDSQTGTSTKSKLIDSITGILQKSATSAKTTGLFEPKYLFSRWLRSQPADSPFYHAAVASIPSIFTESKSRVITQSLDISSTDSQEAKNFALASTLNRIAAETVVRFILNEKLTPQLLLEELECQTLIREALDEVLTPSTLESLSSKLALGPLTLEQVRENAVSQKEIILSSVWSAVVLQSPLKTKFKGVAPISDDLPVLNMLAVRESAMEQLKKDYFSALLPEYRATTEDSTFSPSTIDSALNINKEEIPGFEGVKTEQDAMELLVELESAKSIPLWIVEASDALSPLPLPSIYRPRRDLLSVAVNDISSWLSEARAHASAFSAGTISFPKFAAAEQDQHTSPLLRYLARADEEVVGALRFELTEEDQRAAVKSGPRHLMFTSRPQIGGSITDGVKIPTAVDTKVVEQENALIQDRLSRLRPATARSRIDVVWEKFTHGTASIVELNKAIDKELADLYLRHPEMKAMSDFDLKLRIRTDDELSLMYEEDWDDSEGIPEEGGKFLRAFETAKQNFVLSSQGKFTMENVSKTTSTSSSTSENRVLKLAEAFEIACGPARQRILDADDILYLRSLPLSAANYTKTEISDITPAVAEEEQGVFTPNPDVIELLNYEREEESARNAQFKIIADGLTRFVLGDPLPATPTYSDFKSTWHRAVQRAASIKPTTDSILWSQLNPGVDRLSDSELEQEHYVAEREELLDRLLGKDEELQAEPEKRRVYERKVDHNGQSHGVGRRKTSVARVWMRPHAAAAPAQSGLMPSSYGKITVNGKPLTDYFQQLPSLVGSVLLPLEQTKTVGHYDVDVNVYGGGMSGQAGAAILGISRALVAQDPELQPALRKSGCLTRDPRMVERKKFGQKKARKNFQWVKR